MNHDANRGEAAQALIDATLSVAGAGQPLMLRVAPEDGQFVVWSHYPPDDAVDRESGARWFYHAHPPGERANGEHGHFHLFFDKARLEARGAVPVAEPLGGVSVGADVVHIAAFVIGLDGIPTELITVNRWVTDEWLYPAVDVVAELDAFDLSAATGDTLVNAWLTTAVRFYRAEIADALTARDRVIAAWPDGAAGFEDRGREVLSRIPIDINDAVRALD
jgi:hypothetical protein